MTELARVHKRKLILLLLIAALFVGFKVVKNQPKEPKEVVQKEAEATEATEKKADVITYGDWAPTEFRQVLGQVVSDSNVEVKAELNGTIARVNVSVGDKVYAGQALAGYKTSGDATAINYQSALSSLQTTKLSSQNSVRSAEITLQNAQKSLQQTIAQQDQAYDQAYETLRVETLNQDALIGTAVDLLDQMVQFTGKHVYNQSFAYAQIGNADTIRRQQVKSQGLAAAQKAATLQGIFAGSSESIIVQQANARRLLLEDLQAAYANLATLLRRGTVPNQTIFEVEIDAFISGSDSIITALNAAVSTLQTKIDTAKGARETTRLATLGAQNAVQSAEQALELAKAQAEASVIGAQNQVNLTGASTADLTVRAPISGTITDKSVRVGDLLTPGTVLFTIVNQAQDKKVQAFLTQDELRQARTAKEIIIEIDGQEVTATNVFLSSQLQAQTQKVLAEFTIPAGTTLVGNLATVKIPLGSGDENGSNLLPFSSVSFEPDGAEVLVLDTDGIAQRKKVIVDRVVVSNIEITSGLTPGEKVVEYYKRVLPGEKVVVNQKTNMVVEPVEEVEKEAPSETVTNTEK